MRRINSKTGLIALLLPALILPLSGCGILPKEEEYSRAPVVTDLDEEEYIQTQVMRGDVVVSQIVRASFIPSASEKLSFGIGGERIAEVYVAVGDEVKAGDLLMELDITAIDSQLAAQQDQIDQLILSLSHTYASLSLDLEEADILDERAAENETPGWTSRRSAVESSYYLQINSLNNQIEVANARMAELEKEKNLRQLRASIDGTVTQVYDFYEGERSVKDRQVITLVNMEDALFEVYSSNSSVLQAGKTYTLTANGTDYTVECLLGSSLDVLNVKENSFYFRLDVPDPSLSQGDSGTVRVITEQRLNTLYVPAEAVQTIQGQTVVYILGESGYRTQVAVTTGLSNDTITEILSGVSEGDAIILP